MVTIVANHRRLMIMLLVLLLVAAILLTLMSHSGTAFMSHGGAIADASFWSSH
jgi:hypothetical protein